MAEGRGVGPPALRGGYSGVLHIVLHFRLFRSSRNWFLDLAEEIAETGSTHGLPHPSINDRTPGAISFRQFLEKRASEKPDMQRPAIPCSMRNDYMNVMPSAWNSEPQHMPVA